MGRSCGWKHLKAPSVRHLWNAKAMEAVLVFLRDTRAGNFITISCTMGPQEGERDSEAEEEGEEGGPGPP